MRTIIGRWNEGGEENMRDRRRDAQGSPVLLSAVQQAELRAALQQPPADGGLWSGPKVAQWMQQRLGRPVAAQRGWEYLQRVRYSTHVPRSHHAKADEAVQDALKKTARRDRQSATRFDGGDGRSLGNG